MPVEKSCGAVVFTRINGEPQFVIIRSPEGFYGFPKGHVEEGETEEQTALREIFEETGLRVRLIDGFRTEDSHPLIREGRPDVIKTIVYFLAEFDGQPLRAQESEVSEISLMNYWKVQRGSSPRQKILLRDKRQFFIGLSLDFFREIIYN